MLVHMCVFVAVAYVSCTQLQFISFHLILVFIPAAAADAQISSQTS